MAIPRFNLLPIIGGLASGALCLWVPWLLPPPLPLKILTAVVVAAQTYAAVALTMTGFRKFRAAVSATTAPAHGRPLGGRTVALTCALALLGLACPPGGHGLSREFSAARDRTEPTSAWESLGAEGQEFERAAPGRIDVERIAGAPAMAPLRAYVGLRAARSPTDRARQAVAKLDRQGGFTRSVVLAVIPTGTGWVDPAAVRALELLTRGDVATVAIQYADRPSWVEYLAGTGRVARAANALTAELRARLSQIPAERRPRLLLYGESLGALGARAASANADQTLLVGQPGATGNASPGPRITAIAHPDDPVGWWGLRLAVSRPRGWPGIWLPLISFWQVGGSLPDAVNARAGHGHHYGAELVDAWRVVDPDGPVGNRAGGLGT